MKTLTLRPDARTRAALTLDRQHVGRRLRSLRRDQGLTLKQLSARSGVALSTLSKIELGQISVSYEKLAAAAQALAVDVSQLFDARASAPGAHRPVAVRTMPEQAPRYDARNYDYRVLASDYPGKRMTPLLGTVVARSADEFQDFIRHPGQEFVMVLSGRVRICFENGQTLELSRQQSAYFDSGVGHLYLSIGRAPAQVLVMMA